MEGLRADKPYISDWDKNLTATAENTHTDPNRLPAQWLAEGPGYHGNVSNALWALRDMMLKDTLNISRTLSFEALCKIIIIIITSNSKNKSSSSNISVLKTQRTESNKSKTFL